MSRLSNQEEQYSSKLLAIETRLKELKAQK